MENLVRQALCLQRSLPGPAAGSGIRKQPRPLCALETRLPTRILVLEGAETKLNRSRNAAKRGVSPPKWAVPSPARRGAARPSLAAGSPRPWTRGARPTGPEPRWPSQRDLMQFDAKSTWHKKTALLNALKIKILYNIIYLYSYLVVYMIYMYMNY